MFYQQFFICFLFLVNVLCWGNNKEIAKGFIVVELDKNSNQKTLQERPWVKTIQQLEPKKSIFMVELFDKYHLAREFAYQDLEKLSFVTSYSNLRKEHQGWRYDDGKIAMFFESLKAANMFFKTHPNLKQLDQNFLKNGVSYVVKIKSKRKSETLDLAADFRKYAGVKSVDLATVVLSKSAINLLEKPHVPVLKMPKWVYYSKYSKVLTGEITSSRPKWNE